MGIGVRAIAPAIAALLVACGTTKEAPRRFISPNQTALVIALDPRVGVPQGSDPSFDVGRLFGESMIAAMARDPRIVPPSAPPANVLHLWVGQYAAASQTQVTMTAGAQLDDPTGKKLWSSTLSVTRTSIQAASDELANRLRGDMMLGHGWFVNQPAVATTEIRSRPRIAPSAPAVPQAAPALPQPPAPAPAPEPAAPAPAAAEPAAPAPAASAPPAAMPLPVAAPPIAPPPAAPSAYVAPPLASTTSPLASTAAAPAPPAKPAPKPAAPVPSKAVAGELNASVARMGSGLRKQPQAWQPLTQALAVGTALKLSSRLENEYGIWWYAKSNDGNGWIPEADVTLP